MISIPTELTVSLAKKALLGLVEGAATVAGTILAKNLIGQQAKPVVTKEKTGKKPTKEDFQEVQ